MSLVKNVYFIQCFSQSSTVKFVSVLRNGLYELLTKEDLHAIAKCRGQRMEFLGALHDKVFTLGSFRFRVIHATIDPLFETFIKEEVFIKTWDGVKQFDIKTVSKLPNLNPAKVVDTIQLGHELKTYLQHITL